MCPPEVVGLQYRGQPASKRSFGAYPSQVQAMVSVDGVALPGSSGPCHGSTSDAADEHQASLEDERRKRRRASNRESARRSRMKKKMHLDALQSEVVHLQVMNQSLTDEINHKMEEGDRILQENAWLREEKSNLQRKLHDMQVESTSAAQRASYLA